MRMQCDCYSKNGPKTQFVFSSRISLRYLIRKRFLKVTISLVKILQYFRFLLLLLNKQKFFKSNITNFSYENDICLYYLKNQQLY